MRFLALLILASTPIWSSTPTLADSQQLPTLEPFEAYERTLDNGLHVVVIPNDLAPVVHHVLLYKVGSADEPPGKTGVAHMLEHLMFKDTTTNPAGTFSKAIEGVGGRENAFTSYDSTGYWQTVSKEHLEMLMTFEADRMVNLIVKEEEFKPEQLVVAEERRQRTDNKPNGILNETAQATLFLNHPYQRPIIGWEHELLALTRDDAQDWYDTWYAPNNAVLVVGGDVEPETVFDLAKRTYGAVAAKQLPERIVLTEPPHRVPRSITLKDPRVGLPSVSFRYLAPGTLEDTQFDSIPLTQSQIEDALSVFASAYGSGPASPLYRKLVIEQKVAASVGAYTGSSGADYSSLGFWVSPNDAEGLDAAREALETEIETILETGLDEKDIFNAKRRLIRSRILAGDTITTLPNAVARGIATGQTLDEIRNGAADLAAVTGEHIKIAVAAIVRPQRRVVTRLLPLEEQETSK